MMPQFATNRPDDEDKKEFGAIPFDNPSCTDKSKCITCMRCISVCPKNAKSLPPVLLSVVSTVAKSQFKERKGNSLFL